MPRSTRLLKLGAARQIERVEFCFLDRRLLHDYYLRSKTYDAETAQFTVVRNDIAHLLQHDPELATLVGQVDDPVALRAIDDTARELGHESSIGIAFLYARAARQVLKLEIAQPPSQASARSRVAGEFGPSSGAEGTAQ